MSNQTETIQFTKQIGVRIQKDAMSKTDKDTLQIKGFFTSDNKDMHGDIITRSATERAIEQYRQWGNIRRMHAPDPVGKMRGIGAADGLAWNEIEIEVIDPKAIFEVENELLVALSIGAAIKWEDIEWLEDGGMLINDYLLGEISLVDHPGNYDATLSMGKSVEMLVKKFGVDAVGRSVLKLAEENEMAENTDLEKDALVEDAEVEATDAPIEEEDVETSKEIEEEVEAETEVEAEVEDETVEDTEEAIEEEETPEEDVEVEASVDTEEEEDDRIVVLENKIDELTTLVKTLVEKDAEVVEETVEETEEETPADDSDNEAEVDTDAHKAVVPATEEVEEETPETVEKSNHSPIGTALRSKFGYKQD